jgi:hypothetical protein
MIKTYELLYKNKQYQKLIEIEERYLKKKPDDYLATRNLAFASACIGKSDEGFEYIKILAGKYSSDRYIEELKRFFIYPEFNRGNFHKVIYRCSFFTDNRISQETRNKIDRIVLKSQQKILETLRSALQSYYEDCGRYPSEAQGLAALYEKPVVEPIPAAWNGPYLDRQFLLDPWGNVYRYRYRNPEDKSLPRSRTYCRRLLNNKKLPSK